MAKSIHIRITPPDGEPTTVTVKRSQVISLEEKFEVPVLARIEAGYTGDLWKFFYAVGRDAGVVPAAMTFEELVDSDDDWQFEFLAEPESADPNA